MKKKILISMVNLYNGGAEKSLINLLNEIDYSKYEIDLLLFQKKGLFLEQVPQNVNIVDTPYELDCLYNKFNISNLFKKNYLYIKLKKIIYNVFIKLFYFNKSYREKRQIRWNKFYSKNIKVFDKKYDIAISYIECEPTYFVIDKTIANKKIVWFHNDYAKTGLNENYDYPFFKKADSIVTISNECLEILKNKFPDFNKKIVYIPNIVSSKVIKKLAEEDPIIKYDTDFLRILSIGRLNYQKGFDIAIEAARLLKNSNIKFQWFIIGDGEMKNKLTKLIYKYNLNDEFKLIGTTTNPYSYLNNCDLLVQSSRFEGKSIVLDEAKILKVPFLVTKYPTVFDQADERFSKIVEIDELSIFEGIKELYNNSKMLTEYINNLKKEKYSNEDQIYKYYEIFDK